MTPAENAEATLLGKGFMTVQAPLLKKWLLLSVIGNPLPSNICNTHPECGISNDVNAKMIINRMDESGKIDLATALQWPWPMVGSLPEAAGCRVRCLHIARTRVGTGSTHVARNWKFPLLLNMGSLFHMTARKELLSSLRVKTPSLPQYLCSYLLLYRSA